MRDSQLCRFECCSIAARLLHTKPSIAFPMGTGAVEQRNPLTFAAKIVLEMLWEDLCIE